MKKLKIYSISNDKTFNVLELEKSEAFLDNLQNLVLDAGFVKKKDLTYEFDDKKYDMHTFYSLITEVYDPKENESTDKKMKIKDFSDGTILRYDTHDTELLIIFLEKRIKIVFYCKENKRKKILNSLFKFAEIIKNKQ